VRSQPGRGIGAWILLAPSLAISASNTGTSAGLALRWNDPGELAPTTAQDFESRLSERVGHPAFDSAASDHALSVNWLGTPEQCRVELSLVRGEAVEGTRIIESPSGDCRTLVPALLTVAALLVESGQSEAPPPPPPLPLPSPPPSATTKPAPPSPPPRRSNQSLLIGLGAGASSGFAPRIELGPLASVVWSPVAYIRVGAEGALFFEHQYGSRPGFSLGHQRATMLACGMSLGGHLGLGLCGTAAVHRFSSQGISLPRSERQALAAASLGGNVRVEWRLTRKVWWTGSFGADVTTHPLYFYYATASGEAISVFRQQRVGATLVLALTLELP